MTIQSTVTRQVTPKLWAMVLRMFILRTMPA